MRQTMGLFALLYLVSAPAGAVISFEQMIQQGNKNQHEVAADVRHEAGVMTSVKNEIPQTNIVDVSGTKDFDLQLKKNNEFKKKNKKKKQKSPASVETSH